MIYDISHFADGVLESRGIVSKIDLTANFGLESGGKGGMTQEGGSVPVFSPQSQPVLRC